MKNSQKKLITLSLCTAFILQMNLAAEDMKKNESLGSVDVISTDSNITEGTGSYTTGSMKTSTKLDLSIRETPQSISVITSQELEDKGITTFQQLLGHITGVSITRIDERLSSNARGFEIDYFKIDGIPRYPKWNARTDDLAIFDRVEVVRGANGLTTGAGNPGISINLVRKKAISKEFTGNVSVNVGSWNSYGVSADIGSKLNEDGSIRGRLVVKQEDKDSFMNGYTTKNTLVYGVLGIDLTDTTTVSLGASYHKLNKNGVRWGGLPAFDSNGNRIDHDTSLIVSEDWTYTDTEEKLFFTEIDQVLYDDIKLNVDYSHSEFTRKVALLNFGGQLDTSTGSGLSYYDWKADGEIIQDSLDVNVDIPFDFAGLKQQIIVGASYNKEKVEKYLGGYTPGTVSNFYDYDIPYPSYSLTPREQPSYVLQKAVFIANKLSLTEQLKLIAGARLSSWEYKNTDSSVEGKKFDGELTPYVGLVYDIDDNHSVYTSYTSIFKPQSKKDSSGDYLDPIEGNSYEAGIKGEYFDGDLNATVSIFRILQDGIAADDPSGAYIPGTVNTVASIATEGVTSKGFEVDINGQVTDRLSVSFGIANFEAKDADGKKFDTKNSRTTANVFAKYKVNKDLDIAGGLRFKSKIYVDATVGRVTQEAFSIASLMANYKFNKNTSLQLNVDNLFDKKYYEGINYGNLIYGEPRKFTASLKYTF